MGLSIHMYTNVIPLAKESAAGPHEDQEQGGQPGDWVEPERKQSHPLSCCLT